MLRLTARLALRRGPMSALVAAPCAYRAATAVRHAFGGGFFTKSGDDIAAAAVEFDPIKAALSVDVQELSKGDDMPPMLQYNEPLVEAAYQLLAKVNEAEDLTDDEVNAVSGLVAMLFAEHLISPWEQYCAVTALTDLPSSRNSETILKCVRSIVLAILPDALAQLVCVVDSQLEFRDATPQERLCLHRLVQVIVDNGGGEAATPEEIDQALVTALQGIETNFPKLFQHSNFVYLLQDMSRVCLQARFAYLVNETCLAFDPERSGRIVVAELKESMGKIMPPHAVERIMQGVEADTDGKIFYPQLAQLLMRGEGPVADEGTRPPASSSSSPPPSSE